MEQFPNHELEYAVDDYYDVTDFEDENDSPRIGISSTDDDSADSDFEDDFEMVIHSVQSSSISAGKMISFIFFLFDMVRNF